MTPYIYLNNTNSLIMSEEETKRILEDMEKQGFPLEVRTSRILKAHNWEVTNQVAYSDYEKRKHRTVDIVAEKNVLETETLGFDLWLVVECKRNTKPWVFYGGDYDLEEEGIRRKFVSSIQFSVNSVAYQRGTQAKVVDIVTNKFVFQTRFRPPIFTKIGYASFEPFTNGKGRSVHKAQMQVINAILDLKQKLNSTTHVVIPYTALLVPVIVFDGQLYLWENNKLDKAEGLYHYVTSYDNAFMIEILTIDFLEKYLNNLEQNLRGFKPATD